MGLSAYGNPEPYYAKLRKTIDLKEDGSFRLKMKYFDFHYKPWMPSKELCKLLGGPIKTKDAPLTQIHKDISAALQKVTEEVVFKILNNLHKETKIDNLCLAGGVALNSVANGKILRNTLFKKIWIK